MNNNMHSRIVSLLLTFFLQAPFPPGTASQSLLIASLITGMKKGQRSNHSGNIVINIQLGHIYDLKLMWINVGCVPKYQQPNNKSKYCKYNSCSKGQDCVKGYTILLHQNNGKT